MEITPFSIRFKLYDQLELLEFPNKFFIKPVDSHHQGFSVDRRDGNIKPLDAVVFDVTIQLVYFARIASHFFFSDRSLSIASLTTHPA
ncbi:unnamed protein product [Brassica napus]|uniref:(rape) hypothetical protein n=1 Tax=Brassica napus TaxID=3708 RepID=A0A816VDA3_BRANA|nr:unnamed protein product [Brassica napus]